MLEHSIGKMSLAHAWYTNREYDYDLVAASGSRSCNRGYDLLTLSLLSSSRGLLFLLLSGFLGGLSKFFSNYLEVRFSSSSRFCSLLLDLFSLFDN